MPQLLVSLLKILPTIVSLVEAFHGPSNGTKKLNTAINMIEVAVPAAVQGALQTAKEDGSLVAAINGTVAGLNALGALQKVESAFPASSQD